MSSRQGHQEATSAPTANVAPWGMSGTGPSLPEGELGGFHREGWDLPDFKRSTSLMFESRLDINFE